MDAQTNPAQLVHNTENLRGEQQINQGAPPSSFKGLVVIGGITALAFFGFMGMRVAESAKKQKTMDADRAAAAADQVKKPVFETVVPKAVKYHPSVEINGTLKPWQEAEVNFEAPGRVQEVTVRLGAVVKAGDLLGSLDSSLAGAQVSQASAQVKGASAQLAMAEDNLRRTQALADSKSVPEAALEAAKQQVAAARAGVDAASATTHLAKVGQGKSVLRAPFAGVVTRAPASAGFYVNPGIPGGAAPFRIEDVSRFRLIGSLGEADYDLVKVGATVNVMWRERSVAGKVAAVVPSLDPMTRRAPIEIEVINDPANPLLGYGFVRAKVDGPAEVDALEIPAQAKRGGSQDEVVTVVAGKAKVVRVVHETKEDGRWIVRSGLSVTDVLLLSPPSELADGEEVQLKSSKNGK